MSHVTIFAKYNGQSEDDESTGVLVPISISYVNLLEILLETLES